MLTGVHTVCGPKENDTEQTMAYINRLCHVTNQTEVTINTNFFDVLTKGGIVWSMLLLAITIRASYYLWNTWAIDGLEFVLQMLNEYWREENNAQNKTEKNAKHMKLKKFIYDSWCEWFLTMVVIKYCLSLLIAIFAFISSLVNLSRLPQGPVLTCRTSYGIYQCVNHSLTIIRPIIYANVFFTLFSVTKLIIFMIVKCKYTAFDNMKEWIPTLAAIIQLGKLDAGETEETDTCQR